MEDIQNDKNKTFGNLLLNKGIYTNYSDYDFYGRLRNKINPTIGFSEYCYGIKNEVKDEGMSAGLKAFIIILIIVIICVIGYFGFRLYRIIKIKKSDDDESYIVSSLK